MRRIALGVLVAGGWLCGCRPEADVTQPGAGVLAEVATASSYSVVKLPGLGGTVSRGTGISNRGSVSGFSQLPGNAARHAALWRRGQIVDLGTLGGVHSSSVWPGLNDLDMVAGISQTATPDPLGEDWSCFAFLATRGTICLGFYWNDGVMRALPTLGGNNGFATAINNAGQIVGWAETPVHDPTCNAPQVLQFRAVLWEPWKNRMRQLRPLPGDSTSAATAINERGQAVGISGSCDVAVGEFSARAAVLWDRDRVIDIGNLGGEYWHTPMDINERGDVVGFSNPPGVTGGALAPHAFLWTRDGGIRDLGTLPGDATSQALGINARRQVVGLSTGPAGTHGFLWQNGVMTDLNTLVPAGSGDVMVSAQHINEAGEITGRVREASGVTVAVVLKP